MSSNAAVRARHPQMMLAIVRAQHPALHAEIVSTLAESARLQSAMPVEWLPIAIDIELIERLARQLSESQIAELVRVRQRDEMGSALFKTFVMMAGRLLGLTPASMLRQLDKGWQQLFRECGRVEIVRSDKNGGLARLTAMPRACLASPQWLAAIPVGLATLYELVQAHGTVTAAPIDGGLELDFSWS